MDLTISLETKIFFLALLFSSALLLAMGWNWPSSDIEILKTLATTLIGAFIGAYAKGGRKNE